MKRFIVLAICLAMLFPLFADEPGEGGMESGTVIEEGIASWYTSDRTESLTANGETFDPESLSAAHKSLKFGSVVRVTNLDNGKAVDVRINDRGPFVDGRIIDLTPKAAREIDMITTGIARVSLMLIFEPEVPESKYNRAGDTGWYRIQVGSYSSPLTAYTQYDRLLNAGLSPYAELTDADTIRISVRWIPAYQLNKTLLALSALGFDEDDVLKKSEVNPYK